MGSLRKKGTVMYFNYSYLNWLCLLTSCFLGLNGIDLQAGSFHTCSLHFTELNAQTPNRVDKGKDKSKSKSKSKSKKSTSKNDSTSQNKLVGTSKSTQQEKQSNKKQVKSKVLHKKATKNSRVKTTPNKRVQDKSTQGKSTQGKREKEKDQSEKTPEKKKIGPATKKEKSKPTVDQKPKKKGQTGQVSTKNPQNPQDQLVKESTVKKNKTQISKNLKSTDLGRKQPQKTDQKRTEKRTQKELKTHQSLEKKDQTPSLSTSSEKKQKGISQKTGSPRSNPKKQTSLVSAKIKKTYQRFFKSSEKEAITLFAPQFIQIIPAAQILKIRTTFLQQLGDYLSLYRDESQSQSYTLVFKKGRLASRLTLNDQNQIIGLWFGQSELDMDEDSEDYFLTEFKALPEISSVLVMDQEQNTLLAYNDDLPLAVGSAFKLFVLSALEDFIKQNNQSFNTQIKLQRSLFSLPSGFLHTWPDQTPMTLASLAHLMISQSDNTATDHLIDYLGHIYLEQKSPSSLHPFLSTRQFFLLKWDSSSTLLRQQYLKGDQEEKRAVLNQLKSKSLKSLRPTSLPTYVDSIEWMVSSRDLCSVLFTLKHHPSLQINSGLASSKQWSSISFKGGSEPGVLNYSHLVQSRDRKQNYCVIATLNHLSKSLDQTQFSLLVQKVLSWTYRKSMAKDSSSAQEIQSDLSTQGNEKQLDRSASTNQKTKRKPKAKP